MSYLDKWVLCGGDEAFVLVEVEKDVEDVTDFGALWHIAFGQQDVADVAALEINTMVFLTQDLQLVPLAQS